MIDIWRPRRHRHGEDKSRTARAASGRRCAGRRAAAARRPGSPEPWRAAGSPAQDVTRRPPRRGLRRRRQQVELRRKLLRRPAPAQRQARTSRAITRPDHRPDRNARDRDRGRGDRDKQGRNEQRSGDRRRQEERPDDAVSGTGAQRRCRSGFAVRIPRLPCVEALEKQAREKSP